MSTAIVSTRSTGRTNTQVILELVEHAESNHFWSYAELGAALEKDTPTKFDSRRVCAAVRVANPHILRAFRRELRNVPKLGFRIAAASEHMELATIRDKKARKQIRRGLLTLQNCRLDELDPVTRQLHEGQLLLTSGIFQLTQGLDRRQTRTEQAIHDLFDRVDRLQEQVGR